MTGIIRTESVWKIYGQGSPREVNAVKDISIDIVKGEVTALGGPSGSGKTTILSLLGLLTKPTKGSVYLEERELSSLSEVYRTKVRRERIGFIFQAQYLIPQLTSVENVALPKLCTDMSRDDAENLARKKLTALGMENRLDFRVAELSGGEQQRVSIARSLMNSPDILIADEPSSSIDEALTKDLLATLRGMSEEKGLTVIVASHDPMVLSWSDRIYQMQDGSLVE
ncbi:MAG: ABC transporter ATP-binding protein [Candidatus Thorarchaeota archaeon]|jgi:putative ABC transport system ATP-binding protein